MINVGINADSKAHHAHFMAETVRCNGRRQYFKQKKDTREKNKAAFLCLAKSQRREKTKP